MTILFLAAEAPVAPLTGGRERTRRVLLRLARRQRLHLAVCADEAEARAVRQLANEAGAAGLTVLPYPTGWRGYRGLAGDVLRLAQRQAPPFAGVHCVGLELWPAARAARLAAGGRRVLELHDVPDRSGLKALQEAGTVIVVSEAERERLRGAGVSATIQVVPNGVDLEYWSAVAAGAKPDKTPTLLFPAAFNWAPNETAAQRLVEEVLPRVRLKQRETQVILAGRRPGPGVRRLARWPGVTVVTDPEDMRPLFARARLAVVPTTAAGGTRLKILQVLAAGRAVVSTPEGAAGLDLTPGRDLAVRPLVDEFADEVARLLSDDAARAALAAAGRTAVEGYAWEQVLAGLDRVFEIGD
jgi:glycosyltransferase involved in cell wall biosynthesis